MKQPSPKQTVIGSCRDISYEGFGVVSYDKNIVFVEGMFPGEEGEVELSYRRNGQWFGELRKLFNVSPHRVQPRCKICHACGGCQFQQLDYESQLLWKSQKVKEQFKKRGGMDIDVLPCLGMEEPYNYRNKIQMPFGKDRRGNI